MPQIILTNKKFKVIVIMKGKESPILHWNQSSVRTQMWPPHKGNVKVGDKIRNKEVKWYNLFK